MNRHAVVCMLAWTVAANCFGEESARLSGFEKVTLTDKYYCDGIDATDIDRDGNVDIIAGPFWYAGPTFKQAREYYPAKELPPEASPSNCMFVFAHDFNGNGWQDILVLGRVHLHGAYWYENPAKKELLSAEASPVWKKHFVFERVKGESPTLVAKENEPPKLICHWDDRWGWIEPEREDAYASWRFRPVSEKSQTEIPQFYHGEGTGDVNGDGRWDLIINDGWYEQPKTETAIWDFHSTPFSKEVGGAQMFVTDVDVDGDADIVSSLNAHKWGLGWFEQTQPDQFSLNKLMGDRSEESKYGVCFSQPHALMLADLNRDEHSDIIIGKRMWAHGPQGDVEPSAKPVLYWFEWSKTETGATFVPHLIDDRSGVGVQVTAKDVDGDGRVDILTASKLGSFVFLNRLNNK